VKPRKPPARQLFEIPVIEGNDKGGATHPRCGGPQGSPGLRLHGARRRPVDERTGRRLSAPRRCRETPWELRISRRPAGPVPNRPWSAGSKRSSSRGTAEGGSARGGSRRRRLPQRYGMKCSGGERPGTSVDTSADVQTRAHGPRAIGRRCVSHLLFLRAGGAETLRQAIAKRDGHGNVDGPRLGVSRRSRISVRTHGRQRPSWPRGEAGRNPSRR
jgi:hypothetical protein